MTMLSDRIINAAQELLKSINSSIGGLQNTLLAQTSNSQLKEEGLCKFYMFRKSLIAIAKIGNTGGEIHVYVSMGSSDLPEGTKQLIAALICTSANKRHFVG